MTLTRTRERIAIDCLSCGHCTSVLVENLPYFGLSPAASLVEFTKRLTCKDFVCPGEDWSWLLRELSSGSQLRRDQSQRSIIW